MIESLMNLMIINVEKLLCEVNEDMWVDVVGENRVVGYWLTVYTR